MGTIMPKKNSIINMKQLRPILDYFKGKTVVVPALFP